MRFASLGSGSRGNATLIEAAGTRLLLDCGFAARELEQRLARLEVAPDSLDAILVTHEHQDHIRGVGAVARRYGLPVWLTHGTRRSGRLGEVADTRLLPPDHKPFRIGDIQISPYPVPHDAREPVQFVFQCKGSRLGVLTDAGMVTPHIVEMLQACNALLLECNHDTQMLVSGPYPPSLQRRVGGQLGHLSNRQAAQLLGSLEHARLEHLVAGHLSERNNCPQRVREALLTAAPAIEPRLSISCQDRGAGWFEF